MKYSFIFLVIVTSFCSKAFGQEISGVLKGKVTFITSKNVYVKFNSTENIKIGDSLQLSGSKKPCLLVTNKSSKSIVGVITNGCVVKKNDIFIFNFYIKKEIITDKKDSTGIKTEVIEKKTLNKVYNQKNQEYISGKISLASYGDYYNNRDNRQRIVSRFSLYAENINNSKFSFESYLNYSKYLNYSYNQSPFKVYELALKYNASPTLKVVVGRKINNSTSSLGPIDGLQIEKHFGKNYVGLITGFRPDILNFGFNSNLFQYGGYIGRIANSKNIRSQTTFGVIEQQNGGKIDRRYSYFQHSSTFYNKLNLFSSVELDFYNKLNGVTSSNPRLTNFYVSARYRFNRKLNATVSFDSRKRIIYYETYQSEVERLLSDDVARQGLRFRINTRPFKYVSTGLSYSVRFQSNNQNKSDNINGYIGLYKIPTIGGSLSIHYNKNTSNYLQSNIISFNHSRSFLKDKLYANFYFRTVDYNYFSNNFKIKQNYFGADFSLYISRTLMLSVYGEYSKSNLENNYRINTKIVKRFNNKKKKRHYAY